jgi:hypothetical protein
MATWLEELQAGTVEFLGGWSSPDEVTGTGEDAFDEAYGVVEQISGARGWSDETINEAMLLINYALSVSPDDAELYWQALAQAWPSKPDIDGWNETGEVWESYQGWSTGIFAEATDIIQDTIAGVLWAPDWEELIKAAAFGGVAGLGISLLTGLNPNIGTVGGAVAGGVWNFSNQKNAAT